MLLGAISKRFDIIVEFTAFEDFCGFERKSKNKELEYNKFDPALKVGWTFDKDGEKYYEI